MTRSQRLIAFFIILGAFLIRVWALDDKPAHFDEGVNGFMADEMRERGYYGYQPDNYHGPLHFYVLFAAQQLCGRSLWVLRMPTVLVGVAAVALLFAFRRWFSFRTVAVAAIAMALSPAMIFYSRYAIHEMWLVFFVLLASYAGIGCATGRRLRDRWFLGLAIAGMVLTKETYAVHAIAAVLAVACVVLIRTATGGAFSDGRPNAAALFNPRHKRLPEEDEPVEVTPGTTWRVAAASLGLIIAFYSGFGMNWPGVAGLWETWGAMAFKGYGTGVTSEDAHHKALLYYVRLLMRYEWPALVGFIAAPIAAFLPSRASSNPLRFLALLGLGSFAGYSLISYKTPWCTIAALPPFFLVVGWLFDRLAGYLGEGVTEKASWGALVVAFFAQPAIASWRLNFRNPTDDGEQYDYAYVQTTRDINKLLQPVRQLIARDPLNRYLRGHIFSEAFPLRWELADLPYVYFFEADQSPEQFDADFILFPKSLGSEQLTPDDREWEVRRSLRGVYYEIPYTTRGYGAECWLFLSADKFSSFFPGREPEFHPRIPQEEAK